MQELKIEGKLLQYAQTEEWGHFKLFHQTDNDLLNDKLL